MLTWTSLAAALICTVLAIFLPYGLEPLLGIAALCIAVYTVYLAYEKFIKPFWLILAATAVSVISVVLTLVLIFGHKLGLYTLIQTLNLIVIGLSSYIILRKKWAGRTAAWVMAIICLVFAAFGTFSHLAYGRSVMSIVAEWVLAANKVHGGYYVYQMGAEQIATMNRIANRTNAMKNWSMY